MITPKSYCQFKAILTFAKLNPKLKRNVFKVCPLWRMLRKTYCAMIAVQKIIWNFKCWLTLKHVACPLQDISWCCYQLLLLSTSTSSYLTFITEHYVLFANKYFLFLARLIFTSLLRFPPWRISCFRRFSNWLLLNVILYVLIDVVTSDIHTRFSLTNRHADARHFELI